MRSLDPQGKRALFETPPSAAPDMLRPGAQRTGRAALFSTGERKPGTAVVECSGCGERTRTGLADIGVRMATISAFVPGRKYPHWLRCPACGHRRWCRIAWNE